MPYRCQKCLNIFKTLTLYNKHAVADGACKVEKIEAAKPATAPVVAKPASAPVVAKPATVQAVAKLISTPVGLKREVEFSNEGRDKFKKIKSQIEIDNKVGANKIIADTYVNENKVRTFNPTTLINNSYSSIILSKNTFSCTKCSKMFETKHELEEHTEDDHERSCAECEDDFSWPDPSHECYFTKYKLRMIAGDIMPAF